MNPKQSKTHKMKNFNLTINKFSKNLRPLLNIINIMTVIIIIIQIMN